MKKRILSFLLALCMVLSIMPVPAHAEGVLQSDVGTAIYLEPGSHWPSDTYDYAVWNWYNGQDGVWVQPSGGLDADGRVSFTVEAPNVIFAAIRKGAAASWDNKIYQTADLVVDGVNVCYTLTSTTSGIWSSISSCTHSWDGGVVTTPANCTAEGVMTYTCSLCGSSYTREIAKTEHALDDSGVCTLCGTVPGMVFACYTHLFPEAEYDCYAWAWAEGGDGRWVAPSSTQPVDGYTAFPVESTDDYVIFLIVPEGAQGSWANRVTQTQDIAIQGVTYETLHGPYTPGSLGAENKMETYSAEAPCAHSWSESSTPASCAADGKNILDCGICKASVNTIIPTTGHSAVPDTLTVITPVTCTSDGSSAFTCQTCQQQVTVTIPATGHSFDADGTCSCGESCAAQLTRDDGTVAYYSDLLTAYNAGTGTRRIKLLQDAALDSSQLSESINIFRGDGLILDLNGHTLSMCGRFYGAFYLYSGDATVKNGTVEIQDGNSKGFEVYGAKLTLTDVTFVPAEGANLKETAYCVDNLNGSCELNNVKVQGQVGSLLFHTSKVGAAVLNNCNTYDPSLASTANRIAAASESTLTLNGGQYQYIVMPAGVGNALPEGSWYRYIADGTYIGETAMAGSELNLVEVVPVPLIPTLAETATAILGSPLTLEPGYTANTQDFDLAALTTYWRYESDFFEATQDGQGLIPIAAGETEISCVYNYKGYQVIATVAVTIAACTEHSFDETGFCTICDAPEPAQDSDGNGFWEIANAGNLWWFTHEVNNGNRSLNAELTANIDLSATCGEGIGNWLPIGNNYSGRFNGQGFTISNLYMSGNDVYIGLFGYVKGATIENVHVTGSISSTFANFWDAENYIYYDGVAGGVVAYLNGGTIRNCHVNMTVSSPASGGIGGICGTMRDGLIEGCTAAGNVICHTTYDQASGIGVGGIVGNKENGTLRNCVNRASVRSTATAVSMGGIVGFNAYGTVENCMNLGAVTGEYTEYAIDMAGGIVGNNSATVRNCGNIGAVTTACEGTAVGGIVGNQHIDTAITEYCYNAASVTAAGSPANPLVGYTTETTTLTNNYYLAEAETQDGGRTAEAFASGQVAYELNGSVTEETNVWRQALGTDDYPTFTGELVYCNNVYRCDGAELTEYSNTQVTDPVVPDHTFDEQGLCPVCQTQAVAMVTIGDAVVYYIQLQEAFDQAMGGTSESPATVKLLADATASACPTVANGASVILNLNGHTLDLGTNYITNNGTLELIDSASGGMVTGSGDMVIKNYGVFTLTSGTIYNSNASYSYAIYHTQGELLINGGTVTGEATGITSMYGNITVSGGTVTGNRLYGIESFCDSLVITDGEIRSSELYGICNSQGTLDMTGGTVSSIWNDDGTAAISGGTITTDVSYSDGIYNSGGTTTISGTVEIRVTGTGLYVERGTVYVQGGTITATGANSCAIYHSDEGTLQLSGGTVTGGIKSTVCTLTECLVPGYVFYGEDGNAIIITQEQMEITEKVTVGVCTHAHDNACDTDCNICGAVREITHTYDNDCDTECNICGEIRTVTHPYENGFCSVCGVYEEPELVEGVYQLANAGNLFWFAQTVNDGDSDAKALVIADIDLENREWSPIDNYSGTFDGGGHSITGLLITTPANRMAFFGRTISPAVIQNFTISGLVKPTSGGDWYLGGVAVDSGDNEVYNGSTISNVICYVDLDASAGKITRMGGIVTSIYGGNVLQCLYLGTIQGSGNDVGGIVGYARQGRIENCGMAGSVSSSNYVGGILGYVNNNATYVMNCFCSGAVSSSSAGRVGAIIGRANANFDIAKADNNYYDSTKTTRAFGSECPVTFGEGAAIGKTAEAFASGEVTWLLNGETSDGVWQQTLDGSSLPGFSGEPVYYNTVYRCDGTVLEQVYQNTPGDGTIPGHTLDENGLCGVCCLQCQALVTIGTESWYYATLQEALTKAQEGTKENRALVKICVDVNTDIDFQNGDVPTIELTMNGGYVTLDLNGHVVYHNSDNGLYITRTNLIILDSSQAQTGQLYNWMDWSCGIYARQNSYVELQSGTVGSYENRNGIYVEERSACLQTGGKLLGGARAYSSSYTMQGGEILASGSGVMVTNSTLLIQDGTITAGSLVYMKVQFTRDYTG